MAGRVLNRRELRRQSDQAEQQAPEASAAEGADVAATAAEAPVPKSKRARAKTPAAPRVRKSRKKEPPRMRARWGVFDASMKQLAVFDYNQRADADQKVADLSARKNGVFFLQIVKEPMPEPEPAEATP
jgi:hypothetical protein